MNIFLPVQPYTQYGGFLKMEIQKVTDPSGHTFYKDADFRYSRIIGGIGWPGAKPGFIAVVGEDYHAADLQGKVRHLRILAEVEEQDPGHLFQKAVDMRERFQIERFVADTENASMLSLLSDFNKGLDGAPALTLYDAAFPGDFQYHVSLIKSCVQPQSKTLHFGDKSLLRDYLLEINVDDVSKGKPGDYPVIMALGFIVSYIKSHPKNPLEDRIKKQTPSGDDYNPLTYDL
jgi:hypothetical protein